MAHRVGSSTQELRCSGGSALTPGKLPAGSAKVRRVSHGHTVDSADCSIQQNMQPPPLSTRQ